MAMGTVRDLSLKFSRHHNPANLCLTVSYKSSSDTVERHTNPPILRTTVIQFCGYRFPLRPRSNTCFSVIFAE